jgi:hypothetical protein
MLFAFATPASAAVSVSITVAPPALPVYVQPPCPGDGYMWTPGYKERQDLRDRQATERAEMDRQHASEERRQTLAAAHAHQQEELARRHKQEAEDVERRRHDPA